VVLVALAQYVDTRYTAKPQSDHFVDVWLRNAITSRTCTFLVSKHSYFLLSDYLTSQLLTKENVIMVQMKSAQ